MIDHMTNRYIDHGDGTVTDTQTGLMWEQHSPTQCRRTHAEAGAYCATLGLGGHNDWRLPTVQELMSLVNYLQCAPVINPVFSTVAGNYWSATTYANNPTYAWFVDFYNGSVNYNGYKLCNGYVLAVRAGSLNIRSFEGSI